jgi:hypothetical protein
MASAPVILEVSYFRAISEEMIDTVFDCAGKLPTPYSDILIHHLGGAITALVRNNNRRTLAGPVQDEKCICWVRGCHAALAGHATGGMYLNFIPERQGAERSAYGANYERLVSLKNRYDPTNLFHMNHNIRPTV